VQGIPVGLTVHGYGLDAHFAGGANNPQRYFSAVGNQYFPDG
jgi:hypothetical protein